MQKSLLNLIYVQMFAFSRQWMYLCAVGRRFTRMISYFLVMNSKKCNCAKGYHFINRPAKMFINKWLLTGIIDWNSRQICLNFYFLIEKRSLCIKFKNAQLIVEVH